MKRFELFFFISLVFSLLFFGCPVKEITLPEEVTPIQISVEYEGYANPEELDLQIGRNYAFISKDGKDYAAIVRDAYLFMEDVETHFPVRANENTMPRTFTVKKPEKTEFVFQIYCITDDKWPDAPPRIIIGAQ
jgi:hypothetical protein